MGMGASTQSLGQPVSQAVTPPLAAPRPAPSAQAPPPLDWDVIQQGVTGLGGGQIGGAEGAYQDPRANWLTQQGYRVGRNSQVQGPGSTPGPNFQDAFAPLADVNALAPVNQGPPPGNNPLDWSAGNLFQNRLLSPGPQTPQAPAPTFGNAGTFNPAFGTDMLLQALGYSVPTALAQFGTQASPFGTLTGLGNPFLLPMLLMMMNRPTTTVPFEPNVQQGSPVDIWGMMGLRGFPVFPKVGQPLSEVDAPQFLQVPPVPGGAANLPGNLPPSGQGPFQPGGGEGGGEGGGGSIVPRISPWQMLTTARAEDAERYGSNFTVAGYPAKVTSTQGGQANVTLEDDEDSFYNATNPQNSAAQVQANYSGQPVVVVYTPPTGPPQVRIVEPHTHEGGGT